MKTNEELAFEAAQEAYRLAEKEANNGMLPSKTDLQRIILQCLTQAQDGQEGELHCEEVEEMGVPVLTERLGKKAREIYNIVSAAIIEEAADLDEGSVIQAIALELHDYGTTIARPIPSPGAEGDTEFIARLREACAPIMKRLTDAEKSGTPAVVAVNYEKLEQLRVFLDALPRTPEGRS
jgi:hypothetical protein